MLIQSFVFLEGKEGFWCGKKGDRYVQDDKLRMYGGFQTFSPCNSRESGASVLCVCMRVQSFVFLEGKLDFWCGKKGDRCVQDDKLRMCACL
jgi:hypothetical protein